MLELKNVSTVYEPIPMLMDVSIKVGKGEAVCLLGTNGAGKTTLLRLLPVFFGESPVRIIKGVRSILASVDITSRALRHMSSMSTCGATAR